MQIQVGALPHDDLLKKADGESSATVATRVEQAFTVQHKRQGKSKSSLSTAEIDRHCAPDATGEQLLRNAMTRLNWSARLSSGIESGAHDCRSGRQRDGRAGACGGSDPVPARAARALKRWDQG